MALTVPVLSGTDAGGSPLLLLRLRLPSVAGTPVDGGSGGPDAEVVGLLVALGVLLAASVLVPLVRRRRRTTAPDPALADVPLVVEGLVKTYADGHRAVDDVSWTAGRGQVVGLLGPNGAGKTTSFYMIVGLIQADQGRVLIDDQDITHLPMHGRARAGEVPRPRREEGGDRGFFTRPPVSPFYREAPGHFSVEK